MPRLRAGLMVAAAVLAAVLSPSSSYSQQVRAR